MQMWTRFFKKEEKDEWTESSQLSTYSLEVLEDKKTGDLYFEFPDALMNQMGWDIGDKLIWNELPGGDWKLHLEKTDEDTDNGTAGVGQDSSS